MFGGLLFLWNATKGHRLQPWNSPYMRWRLETYSGLKAEQITASDFFHFAWKERWQLLRFLRWTGEIREIASKRSSE